MNTKKLMRIAAESSLCNWFFLRFLRTEAGHWDNMLAKLEIADMLAPAYFATNATNITCMIWSSLIARTAQKSLPKFHKKSNNKITR